MPRFSTPTRGFWGFAGAAALAVSGCADSALPGGTQPDVLGTSDPGGALGPGDPNGRIPGLEGCYQDECEIGGRCYPNGAAEPGNPCTLCRVPVDRLAWTPDDAATCDDDDPCTTGDACRDGECAGEPLCDDGNPCTDDLCDEKDGTCSTADNAEACVTGDQCTQGQCTQGACQSLGLPRDCGDENPCTADTCEAGLGCLHAPDGAGTCDDKNPCTTGDACAVGVCQGVPVDCGDDDLCTVDTCKAGEGCLHKSLDHLCTDENPCTEQACDPKKGCVFPFNSASCDDGNLCTIEDQCSGGACKGAPKPVDDLNPCTDDACEPGLGVVHLANSLACEDGNFCTLGDSCGGGACFAGAGTPECGDGNFCTDDTCEPASGCRNENNTLACDDGTVCTKSDTCMKGSCKGVAVVCDDANVCTADSCDAVTGCAHAVVVSKACRPTLTVTTPLRGATVKGATSSEKVTVSGTVTSGGGKITTLEVNGTTVTVDSKGAFSTTVTPSVGGNTLILEATDALGSVRKVVQSYLWSTAYNKPVKTSPKSGMVTEGVGIWLDDQVIDDGSRTQPPDDFATIFEMVMATFSFGDLIPSPVVEQYSYKIYLYNLKYGKPKVTLAPVSGGLKLTATIANVTGDVDAIGPWYLPNFYGDMSIDKITIVASVTLSVSNHLLVAKVTSTDVTLTGTDVNIDGALGWLFDFLVDWLVESFVPDMEQKFEDEIADQIEPILEDALSTLAFNTTFDLDRLDGSGKIPIELVTDFQATSFSSAGGSFTLRAGGYATKTTPYSNLGVPGRINCKSGTQTLKLPKQAAIELSVADDALNQLLFGAWTGGLLEFPVPASMLGKLDLSAYGVTDLKLTVSGMLAPTASDCSADGKLRVHLGDVKVTATAKVYGQALNVTMYGSIKAGLEVSASGGELAVKLTSVESTDLQIDIAEDGLLALESTLEEIIKDKLVTGLIGALGGDALASIPLPDIDLSAAMPSLPKGTTISIAPSGVKRDGGNTIVSGNLK